MNYRGQKFSIPGFSPGKLKLVWECLNTLGSYNRVWILVGSRGYRTTLASYYPMTPSQTEYCLTNVYKSPHFGRETFKKIRPSFYDFFFVLRPEKGALIFV